MRTRDKSGMIDDVNPLVSIIVPTHDNETTIVRTLNSLLEQTLRDIEIVVVDDASTDATVEFCREVARIDPRVVIEEMVWNGTALQARRLGVERATGTYIMFCDSDDELEPHAAESATSFASGGGYDIVHFGTKIVSATGSKHAAWEKSLAPFGTELFGEEILLSSPFARSDMPINGNIWSKLYERSLVQRAWSNIDPSLRLPRAQDIYQTLLLFAAATRYGGLEKQLYRYNFGAGKSGNVVDHGSFQHFLAATRTYQAVEEHVFSPEWRAAADFDVDQMLSRLREQLIANQLNYWFRLPQPAGEAFGDLLRHWDVADVLKALAEKHPGEVQVVRRAVNTLHSDHPVNRNSDSHSEGAPRIALLGNIAGVGGVQKMMGVQAGILAEAGHDVTVLSFDHSSSDLVQDLTPGVEMRNIGPKNEVGKTVAGLIDAVRERNIGVLLNHDNYSAVFPWVALVARLLGLRSALFIHSFALRALYDFRAVFAQLPEIARAYDVTVTLSAADRAWWEASGVRNVRALPNLGPSTTDLVDATPIQSEAGGLLAPDGVVRSVDFLWVGRLHDETKNISGLLRAFARIEALRPGATLAIVGGEHTPGDIAKLQKIAEGLGVQEFVFFAGASQNVFDWYRAAKVFLATSDVEGFNLTLAEAQACGLPVVMYELPYLETTRGNPGIVAVEWGDSEALADAAIDLLGDQDKSAQLASAGQEFVHRFSRDAYTSGLRAIVDELTGLEPPTSITSQSNDGIEMVSVPASILRELYRLYGRMHPRMSAQLRRARGESANLRTSLSQLKRALADTTGKQQQLEKAIAQIEQGKPAPAPRAKPAVPAPRTGPPTIGGIWPLWGRDGVQPFEPPVSVPFDDIKSTDEVAIPAMWALDSGVLETTARRHFDGARKVTRYDFVRILYRLAGSPEAPLEIASYSDLPVDDPVIIWAIQRGIMSSPAEEAVEKRPRWNPGYRVPRRTAALLLYRAAGQPRYNAPAISPYADLTPTMPLYKAMCWAAHQGVLPAVRFDDGTLHFEERHEMTRADTVTAIFRQMIGPLTLSPRG